MYIVWFHDKKKAKIAALVMLAIVAICAIIAAGFWVEKAVKLSSYEKITAVVTDFDTSDGKNVWTEFTYVYKDKTYTTALKGHSYWMSIDAKVDLMVDPASPEKAFVLEKYPYFASVITLIIGGVFLAIAAFFGINYLVASSNEKERLGQ